LLVQNELRFSSTHVGARSAVRKEKKRKEKVLESLLDVHRIIFWISFLLIRNESRGRRASGKAVYGRDREEWCCTAPALLYRKASRLWMPYGRMGDIYISINMEESGVYTRHKLQMKQQAKMHADDASII